MKISIITATYNSKKNISACLQSVAGQTHKNIEHIIVDGGSTDKTMEIIKATLTKGLTNHVTKLILEPDEQISMFQYKKQTPC